MSKCDLIGSQRGGMLLRPWLRVAKVLLVVVAAVICGQPIASAQSGSARIDPGAFIRAMAMRGADVGSGRPQLNSATESIVSSTGMPPDIDAQRPLIASGVPCPADILEKTANPSRAMVDSVAQFSAVEHMVHENLSPQGTPRNRETRQYNYVVSISEPSEGSLVVREYLDAGELTVPGKIKTTGLAVLAVAFHPLYRDDFEMKCEGLGDWHGQSAWLVHFQQLEQKPSRLRSYAFNGNIYPVRLKGRAWIGVDNLQIIHLETDLVRTIPEIRLMTEHTSVSYGPVQFKKNGTELWLPTSAEMYVHFGNRRFHRSESFDHFMLFATDAVDKAKLPKIETELTPAGDRETER